MIYHPQNKQSIIDVVLQHHGTVDALISVMKENGFKTLHPTMSDGVVITSNERSKTVQFFRQNEVIPSNLPNLPEYDFDPEDFDVNNGDFI